MLLQKGGQNDEKYITNSTLFSGDLLLEDDYDLMIN